MILYREQLIEAIKFLLPAMDTANGVNYSSFCKVVVDATTCELTTGSHVYGKKIILDMPNVPTDMENYPDQAERYKPAEYAEYLIPRAILEAFQTLCTKHKAAFEKAVKHDLTMRFVDIFPDRLESHKDWIEYRQPIGIVFEDIFNVVETSQEYAHEELHRINQIQIDSDWLIDCLKEFKTNVELHFFGENLPVLLQSPDRKRQAFVYPFIDRSGE